MNLKLALATTLALLTPHAVGNSQKRIADIPYVERGHERQVLDIYMADEATAGRPVMFWIQPSVPSSTA